MQETRTFDRRTFTLEAALAVLSGVAITISGCGGSGGSPTSTPTPTPTPPGDKVGTISANHGHTAVIESAKLTAGLAISLTIRGDANHPHTVELSAADIAAIAVNQRVSRESSTDSSHSHTVTFN
jgi:hypothetical protein